MGIVGVVGFIGCLIPASIILGGILIGAWAYSLTLGWIFGLDVISKIIDEGIDFYAPILAPLICASFLIFLPMMIVGFAVNHLLRKKNAKMEKSTMRKIEIEYGALLVRL